jgi:hypothetical protein
MHWVSRFWWPLQDVEHEHPVSWKRPALRCLSRPDALLFVCGLGGRGKAICISSEYGQRRSWRCPCGWRSRSSWSESPHFMVRIFIRA